MTHDFLRVRLKELGMSYQDLSRELALRGHVVSKSGVQHWVNDENDPPLSDPHFRQALAGALQMDVNDLLERFGFYIPEHKRSAQALRAADMIDQLPEGTRDAAVELIEVLARHSRGG